MSAELVTINKLRQTLLQEISVLFPGNEAVSIVRLILEHVGFSEYSMLKDPSQPVNRKIQAEITKIVNELSKNKPIQYILGECFFYDLKFVVNENVLIPRPETEELVSKILLENTKNSPSILDIGCGSGCISVTLSKNIPESKVYALDIDEKVIETAKVNASANDASLTFLQGNILEDNPETANIFFDLIVSNPPYVTPGEKLFMAANVLKYEPELALFTPENDPLIFYRAIIRVAKRQLAKDGSVWVEINEKFGHETSELFRSNGFATVRLLQDIHGKDRFLKAMR